MILQSGATTDLLTVDPASKAARETPYDVAGNALAVANRGSLAALTGGVMQAVGDYRVSRVLRGDPTGLVRTTSDSLMFMDATEGAAYDSNKWLQTITTSTVTQAAATGMLFNANSTLTASAGAMHATNRKFPIFPGAVLLFSAVARATTHSANGVIELGFGTPATVAGLTAVDGAHWRKDTGGQWLPVLVMGTTEYLGTPISNATFIASVPVTDYCVFTVELRGTLARFCIYTLAGVLVTSQDIDLSAAGTGVSGVAASHVGAFVRQWNNGTVSTTAVQFFCKTLSVVQLDAAMQRDYRTAQAGMGLSFIQSPTAYTQAPNWTNQVAPTTRTVTNTTEQEATLGGHVSWNNAGTSFAGSDLVDLILFGWTVPVPYSFVLTGCRISTANLGAANGATPYTIAYSLAVGHNTASLATAAPNAPRFIPLGFQTLAAAGAVGAVFDRDTIWTPGSPVVIQPGRRVAVVARVIAGTATAAQVIRTLAALDGFYE